MTRGPQDRPAGPRPVQRMVLLGVVMLLAVLVLLALVDLWSRTR